MNYPAYSGPNSECPKCRFNAASTHYRFEGSEFLLRTCLRCTYTWREAVHNPDTPPETGPMDKIPDQR